MVQFTPYSGEAEAQTIGEGDVWIFTDGTVRTGKWVRPDKAQPAHYVDADGKAILLRPGRTWVELPPVGTQVDVTDAPPPATTVPSGDGAADHGQEEEEDSSWKLRGTCPVEFLTCQNGPRVPPA